MKFPAVSKVFFLWTAIVTESVELSSSLAWETASSSSSSSSLRLRQTIPIHCRSTLVVQTKTKRTRICDRSVRSVAVSLTGGGNSAISRGGETNAKDVLSYYLVWSPGMFSRTLLSLLVLALIRLMLGSFHGQTMDLVHFWSSQTFSSAPLQSLIQNVALPLLSSACCSIQLLINLVVGAGGCAGFNKRLGPLRPYFLSVLVYTTATSFRVMHQGLWARDAVLRWTMALLPEIVHFWNVGMGRRLQARKRRDGTSSRGTTQAMIELTVPAMGCVACINKIDSSLRKCAPVQLVAAKAWLEETGGRAHVEAMVSSHEEAKKLAQILVESVQAAGFEECKVDSIRIEEAGEEQR